MTFPSNMKYLLLLLCLAGPVLAKPHPVSFERMMSELVFAANQKYQGEYYRCCLIAKSNLTALQRLGRHDFTIWVMHKGNLGHTFVSNRVWALDNNFDWPVKHWELVTFYKRKGFKHMTDNYPPDKSCHYGAKP